MDPASLQTLEGAACLTCFYHGGCPDGIGGAWALYRQLPEGARAVLRKLGGLYNGVKGEPLRALQAGAPVFHGLAHGDASPPAELVAGRDVVYVDIVPKAETLLWVAALARTTTVLDHHRSAQPALAALAQAYPSDSGKERVRSVYDERRSGAQIAWDWATGGAPRPAVLDYIGDRDLYKFELPHSREVNKALFVEGVTRGFASLSAHADGGDAKSEGGVDAALIERGGAYARYEALTLARLVANARLARVRARLPGDEAPREYCVLIVNSPLLQSELGEALMATATAEVHFAVIWSYNHDRHEIWASARTNRPDIDLSKIVPHLVGATNGGGHPAAAGFSVAGDSIAAVAAPAPPAAPPRSPPRSGPGPR